MTATRNPFLNSEFLTVLQQLRQLTAQRHTATKCAAVAALHQLNCHCSVPSAVAAPVSPLLQPQQQQQDCLIQQEVQNRQVWQDCTLTPSQQGHQIRTWHKQHAHAATVNSSATGQSLPRLPNHSRYPASIPENVRLQAWNWQPRHYFASMPCRLTEDVDSRDQLQAATESTVAASNTPRLNRRLSSVGHNSSSSYGAEEACHSSGEGAAAEEPGRRRRTTESRSAMRRTTESRAAIEDVAVMTKTQLLRRKKAWLAEQCWERQLPHDGLKENLIQHLLDWQSTDQGKQAAAKAVTEAQAAMAVVNAAAAGNSAPGQVSDAVIAGAESSEAPSSQMMTVMPGSAAVLPDAAATADVATADGNSSSSDSGTGHTISSASNRRRRRSTSSAAPDANSSSETLYQEVLTIASATATLQQPPRNAAAAAAGTVTVLLQQLQQQPDNASLVAVIRNALESSARGLQQNALGSQLALQLVGHTGGTSAASMELLVQDMAADLLENSSAHSLAALARACYSREVQNEVLAAALAEAVASVSAQLGPREVYGVLRLLVEHFGTDQHNSGVEETHVGAKAMKKGFNALAEGLIKCSAALQPRQLAEAVHLLQLHKYDDAYGLWMIAKEATERLQEFAPDDVVVVLHAVAAMCIADDVLCQQVAEVVGSNRGSYTEQQMQAVNAALQKMGFDRVL